MPTLLTIFLPLSLLFLSSTNPPSFSPYSFSSSSSSSSSSSLLYYVLLLLPLIRELNPATIMASIPIKASILILFLFFSLHFFTVFSVEFLVGDEQGWALPSSKQGDQLYNEWASKHRFKVGDSIHFRYEKDSIMVVSEEEYNKCHSSHPILFSNNGDTIVSLERPGLFFFISGVSGHCERGQKMIIKVLDLASPDRNSTEDSSRNSSSSSSADVSGGAVEMAAPAISAFTVVLFIVSFFGVLLF